MLVSLGGIASPIKQILPSAALNNWSSLFSEARSGSRKNHKVKKEKMEISEYGAAYSYAETYNAYNTEEKIEETEEDPKSFKSSIKKIVKKTVDLSGSIFRWLDN